MRCEAEYLKKSWNMNGFPNINEYRVRRSIEETIKKLTTERDSLKQALVRANSEIAAVRKANHQHSNMELVKSFKMN